MRCSLVVLCKLKHKNTYVKWVLVKISLHLAAGLIGRIVLERKGMERMLGGSSRILCAFGLCSSPLHVRIPDGGFG